MSIEFVPPQPVKSNVDYEESGIQTCHVYDSDL